MFGNSRFLSPGLHKIKSRYIFVAGLNFITGQCVSAQSPYGRALSFGHCLGIRYKFWLQFLCLGKPGSADKNILTIGHILLLGSVGKFPHWPCHYHGILCILRFYIQIPFFASSLTLHQNAPDSCPGMEVQRPLGLRCRVPPALYIKMPPTHRGASL